MTQLFSRLALATLLFLAAGTASAQTITGTKNVPGDYATLAAAITALNTNGVGTGGATINVTQAQTQTAGYLLGSSTLNATLSASNPLVITGNGNTITAYAGTSTTLDAVFKLAGTDYVTIQGFTLTEPSASTTATLQMEWGVALVKLNSTAPFDGCQNVTVQNNVIDLTRTNTASVGIYAGNHIATATTALTITAASDAVNNLKVYGNTIQDVNTGIRLAGFAGAASPYALYDQNADIGGASVATRNTLLNYGGAAVGQGINLQYQNGAGVSYNYLENAGGGGIAATATHRAVYVQNGTNSSTAVNNNRVIVSMGSTTSAGYGIDMAATGTGTATVNNDTVTVTFAGSSGTTYGIQFANATTIACNGNRLRSWNLASTGAAYCIYLISSANPDNLTVTNNAFDGATTPYFTRTGTSGTTYSYYNSGASTTGTAVITGNNFSQVALGTSSGSFYGVYELSGSTTTTQVKTVTNNTVTNVTNAGSGAIYGVTFGYSGSATVTNNTVTNLSGGGTIYGIQMSSYSFNAACYNNIINTLTSSGSAGTVAGVYASGTTSTDTIRNHTIYGLSCTGAGAANVYGIWLTTGTSHSVYNNVISGLTAPAATEPVAVAGILHANATSGSATYIHHNTVALGAGTALSSTGANFGVSGIAYGTTQVYVYNNILNVNAIPAGTGTVAALRRTAGGTAGTAPLATNLATNNNIYYVNAGANNYLYVEGTVNTGGTATTALKNGYALSGVTTDPTNNLNNDPGFNSACSSYKSFMTGGRDGASYAENNLTGSSNLFAPAGSSYAEGGAAAVTPAVTVDRSGATRGNPADIGAVEFSGTAPAVDVTAPSISYTLPASTYCLPSGGISAAVTDASGINTTGGTKPRMYYKKSTDANAYAGNTSSDNGYKFVEASNSLSPFTFTPDYALLYNSGGGAGSLAAGEIIQYFVVAADLAASPNIAVNQGALASGYCASSVALAPGAFPLAATPAVRTYTYYAAPTLTLAAASTDVCAGNTAALTTSGAVADAASTYLYESAPSGSSTFSAVPGMSSATATTPAVTGASNGIQYRASLLCGSTVVATSNVIALTANNPLVTGTTPATRCGIGTATLGASASGAAGTRWYAAATGGEPLATTASFTTSELTATTNFYVSAYNSGVATVTGRTTATALGTATSTTDYGLQFTLTSPARLNAVDVFAGTGTAVTIALYNAGGTALLYTTASVTTTAGANTISLGWTLQPGTYRLVRDAGTGTFYRESSGISYPIGLSNVGNLDGSFTSVTGTLSTTTYNFLYNWSITNICETPRTQVTATVTPPPAIAVTASAATICSGNSTILNVTSANSGYTYTWTPGPLNGAQQTVSPTLATKYIVNAQDNSGGASNSCTTRDSVTITVNPTPPAFTISPATSSLACGAAAIQLAGSASLQDTLGVNTTASSTGSPYKGGSGGSKVHWLYTAAELAAQGLQAGSEIRSVGVRVTALTNGTGTYENFSIAMKNTAATALATATPFETGLTEVYAAASETVSGTVPFLSSHTLTTPFVWDGTSNLLVQCCFKNTSTGQPSASVNYTTTTGGVLYYSNSSSATPCTETAGTSTTVRPNLYFNAALSGVWTPGSGLYTDAGAATAYTGTTLATVYAKPSTTVTYTATQAFGSCPRSAAATFTVTPAANAPLANTTGASNSTAYTQGASTTVQNGDCELVAKVDQSGGAQVSGNVMTYVYIAGSVPTIASGRPYVPRYYQITPAANASNATGTVTLYASNAEFQAYNAYVTANSLSWPLLPDASVSATTNTNNVTVSKESGSSVTGAPGSYTPGLRALIAPTTVVWNASGNGGAGQWEITFPTNGFSGFFLGSGNGALPVSFLAVAARSETSRNRVEWRTGAEEHMNRYEVEKERNGGFVTLGILPAQGKAATYAFYDEKPAAGRNTYRIKAVDAAGAVSYSATTTVLVKDASGFALDVYPNPTTDKVIVRGMGAASAEATLVVTDLAGRVLLTQQDASAAATLNLAPLPSGTYLLRWSDGMHQESIRITRQ